MAINPTRPVNPAPYQAVQRAASARDVRITRRMTGDAAPVRASRAAAKTDIPTVGQQIDRILSSAEKALFALLFCESAATPPAETAAPAAPPAAAPFRPRSGGQSLGRTIDIHG